MFRNKYKHEKKKDGFTLIELIVVIAIIGLFSAIVVAGLTSSRINAADTSIKANLATVRSQVAIYFDTNGNYGGSSNSGSYSCSSPLSLMFRDPVMSAALLTIQTNGSVLPWCKSNGISWAVVAQLKSGGYWCVDYTGALMAVGSYTQIQSTNGYGFYTCQ